MKIALRVFCLVSVLGVSWAVVGADDKQTKKTNPQSVLEALPRSTSKPSGTPTPATGYYTPSYPGTTPSATVPAGSSISVLAPPSTTVAQSTPSTVAQVATPIATVAQPSTRLPTDSHTSIQLSHGTLAPTPEMWFYEQARQDYNNADLQARKRGEAYAAERRARLAARAWYGLSNSRPTANVTPFMYHYSPAWGSNTVNPFIWSGRPGTTAVIVEARRTVGVSGFGMW